MEDGSPTLEVGFAIDTGGSLEQLMQLQRVMDSAEAKIVADATAIERATGKMLNLGGATAGITAFGNATTREAQTAARELARVEKAGEALSRQLDRDAAAFGKTREEIRAMKVEAQALASEQLGLTEQASRLRGQQEALNTQRAQAAAARQAEANATQRAAQEHAQLAAMVRGSQAAMDADAAAAERLRMSTDPLYAATKRLNDEIAESTRLYYSGATAPAEYARQQEVLTGRLRDVEQQHDRVNGGFKAVGATGKLTSHHMQNLAFQFQDLGVQMFQAAGSSAPLKMGLMAVLQQGAQINGVMSQAGVGIKAVGVAFLTMSRSILVATATNPYLLAGAAAIMVFAGAVKYLQNVANSQVDMKAYASSIGVSADEMKKLDGVTITFGDTAKAVFQVAGRAIWGEIGPAVTGIWDKMKEWIAWMMPAIKASANFLIGAFVAAYRIVKLTWGQFPAVMGDIFYSAVNKAIEGINWLIQKSIAAINWMIAQANKILPAGWQLGSVSAKGIGMVGNPYQGAASKYAGDVSGAGKSAMGTDYVGKAGSAVANQAAQNARDRVRGNADKKGFLEPEAAKKSREESNKRAEALAREAEAMEAKIRNLYALADAYGVSGAAALIAEARVKAETEAIKKQGDVEAFVNRELREMIAQRVVDSAKSTAAMRDETIAKEKVNAMVIAGIVPAERAAELVKDQIADLPLLASIEAAQQRGLVQEAEKGTAALEAQRKERERMRKADEQAKFNLDMAAGDKRIAELNEELRLITATNDERTRELAIFKARQEAVSKFEDPMLRDEYIAKQTQIVELEIQRQIQTDAFNDSLRYQVELTDILLSNMQRAGQGLADAFGNAGKALGDLASVMGVYLVEQQKMLAARDEELEKASRIADAELRARRERQINTQYQIKSSAAQVAVYGDLAAAAKGFFKEGTDGYKAMATAEKVFRAIQFALSVRAMAQDAIETGSALAKSAIRAAKYGVEAVAKAIASLPFPANLVAGAATAAALAAIGISIAGSFGGGKKTLEKANDGTGTVFGDSAAKSESIKNAIDALKAVDTLTLSYSRQMAASLRSIENQIGGFANLLVRNADSLNASGGVNEGFKANIVGSVLGNIPLIGGLLKGLFGTKTTVVGSGLYGADQSLGSILSGGYDASYFSDVQKKKKLFGLTTSTKYSTQYAGADASLENQFTLILKSFNSAIVAAAGPLGEATGDIQQRLNSFVVSIGKIDLKDLTGAEIEEKLNAVFGAAADDMARAAFPMIEQFQKVGEGAFETLVRVSSTIEAVSGSLSLLGQNAQNMGVAAKLGLADQFESISDLTSAVDSYFEAFYTKEEQAAARTAQMGKVFESLGLTMPATLSAFRSLVEAQDLTTSAGQATYATLLQLAPAFADLKESMEGAKSAADIASERQDLERQLLELRGDTAALRALQLAKLDASNRALQEQIWAVQDAQAAAKAAQELSDAWRSVGDSIMDEVKRIRGLSDGTGANTFASLLGQFNAATNAARGGDLDAAKSLPQLSQALLTAAANAATSRQELDRVRAQTAASLEATNGLIGGLSSKPAASTDAALLSAASAIQSATTTANDNNVETLTAKLDELRAEIAQLRTENNQGHAANAANTGSIKRTMDNVTGSSGGDSVDVTVRVA